VARSGSGSIVGEGGIVLTAAHVIEGCTGLAVILPDARRLAARLVGVDPVGDLALLRAPLSGSTVVRLREEVRAGEEVEHHGFPHGARQAGRTVRSAVVALRGPRHEPDSMTMRGEIRSGDSGAGVFDAWGNLVGMAYGGQDMTWYAVRAGRISDFLLLHGVAIAAGASAAPLPSPAARRAVRVVCTGQALPAQR
jgi:S1-C subfamily serine protease